MSKKLPIWSSKTCEPCEFEINGRCRHTVTAYGYISVINHGNYRQACSHFKEAELAKEEISETVELT